MLGVFKSMTHSYQWTGEVTWAETKFGICGPEDGKPLPPEAQCGLNARDFAAGAKAGTRVLGTATLGDGRVGGFVLYQHPDAKAKVFERIFKGFGEGPGTTGLDAVAEIAPAPAAVRAGARALSHASDQAEHIREIVAVMQRLFSVQRVLLKVNLQYIASAAQDERFRTEPAFKLQGSYRNMNKLAEKVACGPDPNVAAEKIRSYLRSSARLADGADRVLHGFHCRSSSFSSARSRLRAISCCPICSRASR